MTDWFARGCVEEPAFLEEIELLRAVYPHIADVHKATTDTLSVNPRAGTRLPVSDEYWVFTTECVEETPSFWVLYRFDAQNVYLASIKEAET